MAKSTGNWEDNYNKLVNQTLPVEGNKEWRFTLEEHRTKGTMQMNVRMFSLPKEDRPDAYSGPTKNGFIVPINSVEDIEKLEKAFSEYFKKIKEML